MVNAAKQATLSELPPVRVEEAGLLVVVGPGPGQGQQGGDKHLEEDDSCL